MKWFLFFIIASVCSCKAKNSSGPKEISNTYDTVLRQAPAAYSDSNTDEFTGIYDTGYYRASVARPVNSIDFGNASGINIFLKNNKPISLLL